MFPDLCRYVVIAIVLMAAFPVQLLAAELKLMPSIALKEEYNDNIFLDINNKQSDFITTYTPSLEISGATEQRSLSLLTGINGLVYNSNSALDAVDFFIKGGFNYKYDPRLAVSAGVSYVQDSRPDRIDQSGLAILSGSDRQNYQMSGVYTVSEKSAANLSYAYSKESYDTSGYLTTTVHSVTFGQDYDLDRDLRQAKLVGDFGYFRSITDTSQADNYTATVGLTKKFHELWNVSLKAGGSFTHSENDVITPISTTQNASSTARDDDLGWVTNIAVNYRGDKTNGSLVLKHGVVPSYGENGTVEQTEIATNLSENFTSQFSGVFGLGATWSKSNQNQTVSQENDENNFILNAGLRYDFSDYLSLEGNYRFVTVHYSNSSADANQNIFMLRLTMRRDLFGQ